ncbi:hypothetical protein E3U23_11190 [Erythrobacter litoralis]|uniref:hypothetical protein n=1 Tax=Erythrobacter litoralis TaxID=39960 RepID=UPI0024350783|nr:hypothetical protein [Erythrobacter litoralis]MDG6079753.1 hypothetical protein [Erythrobacter litoralis]
MPLSDVTTGFGSKLAIDVGAGLVVVAEIDDIPELPTSNERELYETSSFDTEDYKEWKKQPLKDGTPITIMGNYVINSASDATLEAADDAEGALPYTITLKQDDETFEVSGTGLFYNFKRKNPKDSKRTFEITLKPVDKAAIDAASAN